MERTLADELGPYVVELPRIAFVTQQILVQLGALHEANRLHPNLSPHAIEIVGDYDEPNLDGLGDPISRAAPYAAPETIRDGTLTVAANLYSVGAIVRALLGGRDAAILTTWLDPDPRMRPQTASEMHRQLFATGWCRQPGPVPRIVAYVASASTERELLATLRRAPDDRATREVYADWLESQGDEARADHVRRVGIVAGTVAWRALVSRRLVVGCTDGGCPRSWDALAPTPLDNQRHCARCDRDVTFCASVPQAALHGVRDELCVLDDALDHEADAAYRRARSPVGFRTYNPPPPEVFVGPPGNPPRPEARGQGGDTSVLGRFFGWFRRR